MIIGKAHFRSFLGCVPTERQVEIVHQLVQLGAKRAAPGGNAPLDVAIVHLHPAELETLAIIVRAPIWVENANVDLITSKVIDFVLTHPLDPTSTLLNRHA